MKFLKSIIYALLPLCMVSCGEGNKQDMDLDVPLTISISKDIIQSDGKDYAEVIVKLNGEVVNEGLTFYFQESKTVLKPATKYVNDSKFSITTPGTYMLMARYGTYHTGAVKINVIRVAVPPTPEDPLEASVDFKTRALLIQFTGSGCPNCPPAKRIMKQITSGETSVDPDSFVKIDCHNFSQASLGYMDKAEFDTELSDRYGSGYPSLNANLIELTHINNSTVDQNVYYISQAYEQMSPKAGIALNFSVDQTTRQAILKVSVKAGVASEYRVAGVLLEDGIESEQYSGDDWMDTHNSCIRWMEAGNKYYVGISLGQLAAKEEKDYVFVWDLASIETDKKANPGIEYWSEEGINAANLRAAAYVTMPSSLGKYGYVVVNAVQTASNNEVVPYEYNAQD